MTMKTIFLICLLTVAGIAAKAQNVINNTTQVVRIYQVCYDPMMCSLVSTGNHVTLWPGGSAPLPTPVTPCGVGEETGYWILFQGSCGVTNIGSFTGTTCANYPASTSVTNAGCFSPATVPITYDPVTGDLLIN